MGGCDVWVLGILQSNVLLLESLSFQFFRVVMENMSCSKPFNTYDMHYRDIDNHLLKHNYCIGGIGDMARDLGSDPSAHPGSRMDTSWRFPFPKRLGTPTHPPWGPKRGARSVASQGCFHRPRQTQGLLEVPKGCKHLLTAKV